MSDRRRLLTMIALAPLWGCGNRGSVEEPSAATDASGPAPAVSPRDKSEPSDRPAPADPNGPLGRIERTDPHGVKLDIGGIAPGLSAREAYDRLVVAVPGARPEVTRQSIPNPTRAPDHAFTLIRARTDNDQVRIFLYGLERDERVVGLSWGAIYPNGTPYDDLIQRLAEKYGPPSRRDVMGSSAFMDWYFSAETGRIKSANSERYRVSTAEGLWIYQVPPSGDHTAQEVRAQISVGQNPAIAARSKIELADSAYYNAIKSVLMPQLEALGRRRAEAELDSARRQGDPPRL